MPLPVNKNRHRRECLLARSRAESESEPSIVIGRLNASVWRFQAEVYGASAIDREVRTLAQVQYTGQFCRADKASFAGCSPRCEE